MAKRESTLYPIVEKWAKRHFRCFRTGVNTGLKYGRIDVVGIRDTGGDLSGEVDLIGIEVKRGVSSFANMCGQALGYSVYVNRVYLADSRPTRFSTNELQIASHLGIGLIQVKGNRCIEAISSPVYKPVERMRMALLEKMHLGQCQWCQSIFDIGQQGRRVVRQGGELNKFRRALESERGLMFWNFEIAKRKRRLKLRTPKGGETWERRYICPDCIWNVAKDLLPKS